MATVRTVMVKSSGGDYTSLSAAEAGEQADLVSLDRQLDIECYSFEDTTQVTISGSTVDATRYIRVYTPSTERHDGKWNTSKYRVNITSGWASFFVGFNIATNYTRIEGLQVSGSPTTTGRTAFGSNAAVNNVRLNNNVVRLIAGGNASCVALSLTCSGVGTINRVWNNVIYGDGIGTGMSISAGDFNADSYLYSNTVYNFGTGITSGGGNAKFAKNNLVNGCTTCYSGSFNAASSNNISEDATSPNSGLRSLDVTFVDEAGFDLHLASGDTAAKDAGTDLSADGTIAFSDDIDSQTRSGTWDIGADEYVAGGSTPAITGHINNPVSFGI